MFFNITIKSAVQFSVILALEPLNSDYSPKDGCG